MSPVAVIYYTFINTKKTKKNQIFSRTDFHTCKNLSGCVWKVQEDSFTDDFVSGVTWRKVFSHDTSGGLFTSGADALTKNPTNPDAKLFSVLDELEPLPDGTFHLKICYPELVTAKDPPCNEWTQTSNPATNSTIVNYQPVNIAFFGLNSTFNGLGVNSASQANTYIDDQPEHEYWHFAIGALQFYEGDNTIPGPVATSVQKVELYAETTTTGPPSGSSS